MSSERFSKVHKAGTSMSSDARRSQSGAALHVPETFSRPLPVFSEQSMISVSQSCDRVALAKRVIGVSLRGRAKQKTKHDVSLTPSAHAHSMSGTNLEQTAH